MFGTSSSAREPPSAPGRSAALSEVLDTDAEAYRARYLHRITEGDKVISEEELTGYAYRPPWNVLERELVTAGFTQTEGAEGLLAWRLA
jgi:hypothetical protein